MLLKVDLIAKYKNLLILAEEEVLKMEHTLKQLMDLEERLVAAIESKITDHELNEKYPDKQEALQSLRTTKESLMICYEFAQGLENLHHMFLQDLHLIDVPNSEMRAVLNAM